MSFQTALQELDQFASDLTCSLCTKIFKSPFTFKECGHTFCRECIMSKLKKKCFCPTCNVPVQVKGLHKNLTFSTLVACTSKLKDLLELRAESESARTVLDSILDVDSMDETQMPEIAPLAAEEIQPTKAADLFSAFQALDHSDQETQMPEPSAPENESGPEVVEPSTKRLARRSAKSSVKVTPVPKSPRSTRMKTPKSAPVDKIRKDGPNAEEKQSTSKESIKILVTGIDLDVKRLMEKCCQNVQKGINAQIVNSYNPNTIDRIVVDVDGSDLCIRTTKYLRGILDGKIIVKPAWFWDSLSKKEWLDPMGYLVKGDSAIGKETNAVKASLENAGEGKLFADYTFYLVGNFGKLPSKEDLTTLLKAGGAKVLSSKPRTRNQLPENHMIIYDPDFLDDATQWVTNYDQRENGLWVLECISWYKILPIHTQTK